MRRVLVIGDSNSTDPYLFPPDFSWPELLRVRYLEPVPPPVRPNLEPRGLQVRTEALGSHSMLQLRILFAPLFSAGWHTLLICAGTVDLIVDHAPLVTMLDRLATLATLARAAGIPVVGAWTVPPSSAIVAGDEAVRVAYNPRIGPTIGDPGLVLDASSMLSTPGAPSPALWPAMQRGDGTHLNTAGSDAIARGWLAKLDGAP